jgi:hypothetical protein
LDPINLLAALYLIEKSTYENMFSDYDIGTLNI